MVGLRAFTHGGLHTRVVVASRWSLWVLVGLIVGIIVWIASGNGRDKSRLVFSNISKNEELQNVMEQPRYQGMDEKNQPYTVIADKAVQKDEETIVLHNIRADMNQKEGKWLALNAGEGELDMKSKKMQLYNGVSMFYDGGYEFHTDHAQVDIHGGSAYGDAPVEGQGPTGTLEADGFSVADHAKVIRFNGSVRMKLYP